MDIGRPRRIIEVEPATLPLPDVVPDLRPEPVPNPEPVPEPGSVPEPQTEPVP